MDKDPGENTEGIEGFGSGKENRNNNKDGSYLSSKLKKLEKLREKLPKKEINDDNFRKKLQNEDKEIVANDDGENVGKAPFTVRYEEGSEDDFLNCSERLSI